MGFFDRFLGPPSKGKFANLVVAEIQRAGEKRRIIYDPSEFRLTIENENGRVMFLNNAFAEYSAVPKTERSRIVARFVRN